MGTHYQQFSIAERGEIARLSAAQLSVRPIAAALDRAPSTISRELDRNASATAGDQPECAHQKAQARCWRGSRLERDAALRETVLSGLGAGWSPAQVSGRLALEYGRPVISHESSYRFIYAQLARTKDYSWRLYLPRGKSKRGWRGRRGKAAVSIAAAIARLLSPLPAELRRSVVFDHGTEFARHLRLHTLGIPTYFCAVRSPWQKGEVANAIGRLRRFLPRRFYQGVQLEANAGVGANRRAASVPQYAPATPRLPDARRSIRRRRVALEM